MNIHDNVNKFINDPSDLNFANAVAALVECREYCRQNQNEFEEKGNLKAQIELARNMKSFPTKAKREQFEVIARHLSELGIEICLYRDTTVITAWKLKWGKDLAMLFMGADWEICSARKNQPLKGQFEGFDLLDNLECNGIDVSDW